MSHVQLCMYIVDVHVQNKICIIVYLRIHGFIYKASNSIKGRRVKVHAHVCLKHNNILTQISSTQTTIRQDVYCTKCSCYAYVFLQFIALYRTVTVMKQPVTAPGLLLLLDLLANLLLFLLFSEETEVPSLLFSVFRCA